MWSLYGRLLWWGDTMIEILCLWIVTLIAMCCIYHMRNIAYSLYVVAILSLLATGLMLMMRWYNELASRLIISHLFLQFLAFYMVVSLLQEQMDNPGVDCLHNSYVYFLWYSLSLSFLTIPSNIASMLSTISLSYFSLVNEVAELSNDLLQSKRSSKSRVTSGQ